MKVFRIVSSAGADLGIFEGATAEEALDAMARDAGYSSLAEATEVAGPFDGTVKELNEGELDD